MYYESEAVREFYKFVHDDSNKNKNNVSVGFFVGRNCIFSEDKMKIDIIVNWDDSGIQFKVSNDEKAELKELGFDTSYYLNEAEFEYSTIRDQLYVGILEIKIDESDKWISVRSLMY